MGNTDLRQLVTLEDVTFSSIEGRQIAVDFNNWLYKYLSIVVRYNDKSVYTSSDGTKVPNLVGIIQGLPKFYERDLQPVFIFDGRMSDMKADEMERRQERRDDAAEKLEQARERGDIEEVRRLRAQAQELTPAILETSERLLNLLDIPTLQAPGEADSQIAYMAEEGTVDYAGTDDYDAILFGAPLTLRNITSGELEVMNLETTLSDLEITRPQLVEIAMLCGTDYNQGVHGVGPKTALGKIRNGATLEDVLAEYDATIENKDKIIDAYLNPQITHEFSIPHPTDPKVETARSFVTTQWGVDQGVVERGFSRLESQLPTKNT
jgi:flap endonuclease-1